MIELIVGLPGSGKSYYATYLIYKEIKKIYEAEVKNREYKYKRVYTNIEGIKENRYVKVLNLKDLEQIYTAELKEYIRYEKEKPSRVKLNHLGFDYKKPPPVQNKRVTFDEDIIERVIAKDNIEINDYQEELLKFIEGGEKVDSAFIEYFYPNFVDNKFDHALFIIDEARIWFGSPKPWAARLIEYHRHYKQDYIFVTQSERNMSSMVTSKTEFTTKALSASFRWRKNVFEYVVYGGGWIHPRGDNEIERKKLKASPFIFNLYESGGKRIYESVMFKRLWRIALFGIVVLGFFFYSLFNLSIGGSEEPKELKEEEQKNEVIAMPIQNQIKEEPTKDYKTIYVFNQYYVYKGRRVEKELIKQFLEKNQKDYYFFKQRDGLEVLKIDLNEDDIQTIFNIKKEEKNEKDSNSFTFFSNSNKS